MKKSNMNRNIYDEVVFHVIQYEYFFFIVFKCLKVIKHQ